MLAGYSLQLDRKAFYFSLLGIRPTAGLLYYFAPAWWYISLLIQLYLVFPFLWKLLAKRGPVRLLAGACLLGFGSRLVGLFFFESFLDAWSRGAFFITRVPEFAFGMSLAWWFYHQPVETRTHLGRPSVFLTSLVLYLLATVLSLFLTGMALAPFLLGTSLFVMLIRLFGGARPDSTGGPRVMKWLGRHSYSLYLVHHPLILYLSPSPPGEVTLAFLLLYSGVMTVLTVLVAILLEWLVNRSSAFLTRTFERHGPVGTFVRTGVIVLALVALAFAAEILVRNFDPQEVRGWGERSSLEPHADFGWRLIPNRVTRLRWESYDYVVTANSLGFPGPDYPTEKPTNALRILVTGDAFTSAEGVDTDRAWPRLLEKDLQGRLPERDVQVLNFGITGYGPNQYAAVVRDFVPRFKPDLVVVCLFVNDLLDVQTTDEEFRSSIGFDLPAQSGISSVLDFLHLRRFFTVRIKEPLREAVKGLPGMHGYFLANISALETGDPQRIETGKALLEDRLAEIAEVCASSGARLVLAVVPASVQICGPSDLSYYPRPIDLRDKSRYDLNQPQRLISNLADTLGFPFFDLRVPLRRVKDDCPYQRRNMHWTEEGHRAVAAHLADSFLSDGLTVEGGVDE
jgi:peptidoglycan/LPS O-acetylase OafA/YrhL